MTNLDSSLDKDPVIDVLQKVAEHSAIEIIKNPDMDLVCNLLEILDIDPAQIPDIQQNSPELWKFIATFGACKRASDLFIAMCRRNSNLEVEDSFILHCAYGLKYFNQHNIGVVKLANGMFYAASPANAGALVRNTRNEILLVKSTPYRLNYVFYGSTLQLLISHIQAIEKGMDWTRIS